MRTYKSESNVKPVEVDINLDTVYVNTNITEVTREGEEGEYMVYEYDVTEYPIQEYAQVSIAANSLLIEDLVATMLGGE